MVQTDDESRLTIDVPATPSNEGDSQAQFVAESTSALDDNDLSSSTEQAEIIPALAEKTPSVALPENYEPIPVPDAPALSQALHLARSLRPLARQIAVGLPKVLDEDATVDHIADTGVWQPVLRPESELWLDVALVFDTSPSMCLWQRLGADLHRLLARYGEFRDVRIWTLKHSAGTVELAARNGTVRKPSELLTGDRRRLIVVVSDCVASAWHDGTMRTLIGTWSAKLPTVVFQVFPERLWSRTALVNSVTVELQGKQAGLPSDNLHPTPRSVWDEERVQASLNQSSVKVPVVPLEPDSLFNWAQVVVGDRRFSTLGIVWDAQPVTLNAAAQSTEISPSVLNNRIDNFVLNASPTARELAKLLTSAPVITLPIVRLIKRSMLPQASAVHMAEVFMSGLLTVSGDQKSTFDNAEKVAYELVDDLVRDRLRAGMRVVDARDVLKAVSDYVADGLGKSVSDFWALLRTPADGETPAETQFLDAFATVTAKILRGLGGEFEAIANTLDPAPAAAEEDTAEDVNFVFEDFEYEAARLLNFPAIQDCDYEVATITNILKRFDFESACCANLPKSLRDSTAYRQLLENYLVTAFSDSTELEQFTRKTFSLYESFPSISLRTPILREKSAALAQDICQEQLRINLFTENLIERDADARAVLLEGSLLRRRAHTWGYTENLSLDPDRDIGLDMVAIPKGHFTIGSPESELDSDDDERPQHEVVLLSFYMGRYAITQAQWRVVAGYERIEHDLDPDPSSFKGDNRPVENVSWDDAQEFCRRLSAKTGQNYYLPSEAQWEYACRAGTATPFYFGETISPDLVNYNGNYTYANGPKGEYREETTDVGSFPANNWGLHDMHGNVREWCEDDWHSNYEGAPVDGSAWIESDRTDTARLLRGGSWSGNPRYCRSAYRFNRSRDDRSYGIGFRVCCVLPMVSS